MYSGVFLIWYKYKANKKFYLINGLRLSGALMIVVMVYIFRSDGNAGFSFRSWGILGTIGWGYLMASIVYMGARDNLLKTAAALLFFLVMNMLSKLHLRISKSCQTSLWSHYKWESPLLSFQACYNPVLKKL
jgi:hypothetical protein